MRLAWAAAVLALAAGCLEEPGFEAVGGLSRAMVGYAYDGRGLLDATGSWIADVDPDADAGSLRLHAEVGNDSWDLAVSRFRGSAPYQEGGVACGHVEHGASGNGDAALPAVRVHCSGWGLASGTRNGRPAQDPATGDTDLPAHFMVTRDGVRGPDGTITNKAGTRPYDPRLPVDARVFLGQEELHLLLLTNDAARSVWFHLEGTVSQVRGSP